jgi:hypothetical protein
LGLCLLKSELEQAALVVMMGPSTKHATPSTIVFKKGNHLSLSGFFFLDRAFWRSKFFLRDCAFLAL